MTRVTVCQLDADGGDLEAQWRWLVEHVTAHGSELVVLPEMPFAPWLPATADLDPDAWKDAVARHDEWLDRLGELGPAAVVGTRPVVEDGRRYNEAFVRDPDAGVVGTRRKTYLPDEPGFFEATWYERGPVRFDPATTGVADVGVLICTELWFGRHAREYGQQGVDVVAVPRATPATSTHRWEAAARVAAMTAGAYCLSANRGGRVGDVVLGGAGWIIDPEGEVLARTTAAVPAVTVDVDLAVAAEAKRTYPRYVDASPR